MTRKSIMTEQAKAITEARRLAKKAVSEQWRRDGIKLSHIAAHELTSASMAYLAEHEAELIEKARRSLCKS